MKDVKYFDLLAVGLLFLSAAAAGPTKPQAFSRSFRVADRVISVSQVPLETDGLYPTNGVIIEVKRGDKVTVNQTREISGRLRGAWVTDLDRDHDPEVVVSVRAYGTGGYGDFSLFEIEDGTLRAVKRLPLPKSLRSGYRGHDRITVSAGRVVRKFQAYRPRDPNCCPSGPLVEIVYDYREGQMVIERTCRRYQEPG